MDSHGNLFAAVRSQGPSGGGTIVEVPCTNSTTSTYSAPVLLYSFTGGTDGGTPDAALIIDRHGNLFGTASVGGTTGYGTVFELPCTNSATATYATTPNTLVSFTGTTGNAVGQAPQCSLYMNSKGCLFGTTSKGGTGGTGSYLGTAFELTPMIPGDINLDGLVDVADYDIWAANVGATNATWSQGDLNGDGLVDVADYDIWAANVGATSSAPEPATMSLLVLGGIGAMLRRRK
jgi:hypothetical protein